MRARKLVVKLISRKNAEGCGKVGRKVGTACGGKNEGCRAEEPGATYKSSSRKGALGIQQKLLRFEDSGFPELSPVLFRQHL